MGRRDWYLVGAIWIVITILFEVVVLATSFLPKGYAREAEVVDEAFVLLMILAAPVFAMVVAMIIFSVWRFRASGPPTEDGPPLRGNRRVVFSWLFVTTALTAGVLINPGFVGLADIRGEPSADMVIEIEGRRFKWIATYPGGGVAEDELVLPVDTRIRFDVTSPDVLHSFWIPAFRVKTDAVPGRVTQLYVTTEEVGSFDEDPNLRVQCAELCGVGHAGMDLPVRVVEQAEYESWTTGLAQDDTEGEG